MSRQTTVFRHLVGCALLLVLVAACSGSDTAEGTTTAPDAAPASTTGAPTETTVAQTDSTAAPDTTRVRDRSRSRSTTTAPAAVDGATTVPPDIGATPAPIVVGGGASASGPIGVVGCSNTDQVVSGYLDASSLDKLAGGDLGGGSFGIWGDPGSRRYDLYWGLYDERRPADGYDAVWVQMCIRAGEHGGVFDGGEQAFATHVVEQIRQRDPQATIWISPINFYGDGQVCTAIGPEGPAIAAQTADWAVANLTDVTRGPDLGPMLPEHIGLRDDCHLGRSGRALAGTQLVSFFDG